MSKNSPNPCKVITGPNTRWSYVNVWDAKSINGGTCFFMFLRCHLAQMVYAAVDIAVPSAVCFYNSIHHRLRLLTRCRIVQIHQLASVYLLF